MAHKSFILGLACFILGPLAGHGGPFWAIVCPSCLSAGLILATWLAPRWLPDSLSPGWLLALLLACSITGCVAGSLASFPYKWNSWQWYIIAANTSSSNGIVHKMHTGTRS